MWLVPLLACAGTPSPAPDQAPVPAAPTPLPAEVPVPPDMPAGCVLQVFRPRDGYALRVWGDGRVSESRGASAPVDLDPFDIALRYPEARQRFADAQVEAWTKALTNSVPQGPHLPAGTQRPGGGEVAPEALHFSVSEGKKTATATVLGDLTVPASLGPLAPTWNALAKALWAPAH